MCTFFFRKNGLFAPLTFSLLVSIQKKLVYFHIFPQKWLAISAEIRYFNERGMSLNDFDTGDLHMKYGFFDDARKEYVITTPRTPLPWINYLGCEDFFALCSNTAGGYAFYRDARLRRLTRYRYNNCPLDSEGFRISNRTRWRPDHPCGSFSTVQKASREVSCFPPPHLERRHVFVFFRTCQGRPRHSPLLAYHTAQKLAIG